MNKTKLFLRNEENYLQFVLQPDLKVRVTIDNEQLTNVAGFTLTTSEAHALAEFLRPNR